MIKKNCCFRFSIISLCLLSVLSAFAQSEEHTAFATEKIIWNDRSTLQGGSIAANGNVEIGNDSVLAGNIFSAGNVRLKDRAVVSGNVTLNGSLTRGTRSHISGGIDTDAQLPVLTLPEKSFACGTVNISLYSQQSMSLPPGDYDTVLLFSGATLSLAAGSYNMKRLKLQPDTTLLLDGTGGRILINVMDELNLGDRITMLPTEATNPMDVQIYIHQTATMYVGGDSQLTFALTAPRAEVYIGSRTILNGKIAARKLTFYPDVTLISGSLVDTDNDWMPDMIETAIGRDPAVSQSPDSFAKPDKWLNDPSADQRILYQLPFGVWLSEDQPGDYTYLEIPAGAMASAYNPVITFADPAAPGFPAINLAPGEELLGTYRIYGDINPGYNLNIPFPVHRNSTRIIGAKNVTLAFYDTATAAWVKTEINTYTANAYFALLAELNTSYYVSITDTIILVDADAASGGSGRGAWQNAVPTIQEALTLVTSPADEIWVAEGTYYPSEANDRTESITLKEDVPLYGGFEGFEHLLTQRNPEVNPTIISGNIGDPGDPADNSYTILRGSDNTLIDGFEIREAFDERGYPVIVDGAIAIQGISNMEIRNCRLMENLSAYSSCAIFSRLSSDIVISGCYFEGNTSSMTTVTGAGIALSSCSGAITIENCIFKDNNGGYSGSIAAGNCSDVTITSCLFIDNGGFFAGGLYLDDDNTVDVSQCTFTGNSALMTGGGINCFGAGNQLTISNSIIWNNYSNSGEPLSEIFQYSSSVVSVSYSNIEGTGGSGSSWGLSLTIDAGGNIDADPLFADSASPLGPDGIPATWDDGLRLQGTNSPCAGAGTGTPVTDLLGQLKTSGSPDLGAYGVTFSEHAGYTVDFLDHRSNAYGFDKVPLTSSLPDPGEIYINLPLGGSTSVNVVVPDPTGLFLRSSDTSVFTIDGATANALPLSANVTGARLNALSASTTHLAAFLEVCDASQTVLRALHVEAYLRKDLPAIGSYRIVDDTSSGTGGDIVGYSSQLLKDELNKAFHQAVIHAETVDVDNNKIVNFDLNGNGSIDHYPGSTNDSEVAAISAADYASTIRFGLFNGCTLSWRITAPASANAMVIYVEADGWMTGGSQYSLRTAAGDVFYIFTELITPTESGFEVRLSQGLAQAVQAGDEVFSHIQGLSSDPQIVIVDQRVFATIAHEMLHRWDIASFADLDEPDNIMYYVSGEDNKILRYRAQARHYAPDATEEQWNQVPR